MKLIKHRKAFIMNMLEKFKENDGIITVSSLEVAKDFEKRHDNVIRDIKKLIESLEDLKNEGVGGVLKNDDTPEVVCDIMYL